MIRRDRSSAKTKWTSAIVIAIGICAVPLDAAYSQFRPVEPVPVPIDPMPVDPGPITPLPINPTPISPTPINPTPITPAPITPTPIDPTPVNPTPVDPTNTDVTYDTQANDVTSDLEQTRVQDLSSLPIMEKMRRVSAP